MSSNNPQNIFATFGSSSTPTSTNATGAAVPASSTSSAKQPAKTPPIFGQTSSLGATAFQPASASAPSSSSPFGTSFASLASGSSGQTGGGLFGAAKNNTTSTPALGFSSANTNPLLSGAQSVSGSASTKSPFSSLPTGNLFGSAAPAPSATAAGENPLGLFGTKSATTPADTTTSATNKQPTSTPAFSLFDNSGTTSASAAKPAFPASGLFANAQKKNEGESQPFSPSPFSSLPNKPTLGEAIKEPKAGDKADAGTSKTDNKAGSVLSHEGSKETALSKNAEQSTSTALGLAGVGSTTVTPASTTVPAPSMLRGKTVEDIVNRWSADLETQARAFSQFASEVAVWDRALIENGNYISALYATVIQAESTQASLDQTLEHVEQQQRQLVSTLDQYEKTTSEILNGSGGVMASTEGLGLADSERDKSYALAANLYTQLDDLSHSLTQMVDTVNGLNISPTPKAAMGEDSNEDPISTIAGILNAHLSSLQWIDSYLRDMEGKAKDAERKIHEVVNRRGADGFSKVRSFGLSSSRR